MSTRSSAGPRWLRRFAAAAVLVLGSTGVLFGISSGAASGASADPRTDQVRALLERQGYRVRRVKFAPADEKSRAVWVVDVDARYTQPTYRQVEAHFVAGLWAITSVAATEPDAALFVTQVWRTYDITFRAGLKPAVAVIRGLQNARTEAERFEVLRAFVRSLNSFDLDVRDEARKADVPALDFLAANVRDDSGPAAQTIPHFVAAQIKTGMERQGLKNVDVDWAFRENGEARWWASSAAAYAQPSYDTVYGQANKAWWVLYNALSGYGADSTRLEARQIWRQYRLEITTTLAAYGALLKALEAAGTAAAPRQEAFRVFLKEVRMMIYDIQAKKYIPDDEEFIRQYFAR